MRAKCHPRFQAVTVTGECKYCEPRAMRYLVDDGATPTQCPHCHAEPPGWQMGQESARCAYCGQLWERRWAVTA